MFRVDLRNSVKNDLYIAKEYHIQPSELKVMKYYEYEWILEEIKIIQKEQERQEEAQNKQYNNMQKSLNPASMMSNIKMPSISMPKVNIPKL